jgi:cytochrome c
MKVKYWMIGLCLGLTACQPKQPPAERSIVTLSTLVGDVSRGKQLYADECQQCHQLQLGKNNKGPQLLRIYGAKAATLADYTRYSAALKNSQWTWDFSTLDRYLADPDHALPNTKMLYDGLNNSADRQAIIAYLSTLR